MASRTIFYTQSSKMEAATITDIGGGMTATGEERLLDYRKQSKLQVTGVSSNTYAFRVDLGSGVTLQPQYYGFLNHNFSNGTLDVKLYTGAGATDDGTTWTASLDISLATASNNDFLIGSSYSLAKRYFKIELSNNASTATYLGGFFMLTSAEVYQTSRDPSPVQQIGMSREGQVYNESHGGQVYTVTKYGRRTIWRLKWETISDADLLILQNFEAAVGGKETPFIFTLDNGSTYLYGRFASDLTYSVGTDADLNDVEFLIKEEV